MATNMKSLNGYGFDASALGGHDPSYYATSEDIQQVRNEIPTELPNPNALTFTGAVSETYDGSAPKSVAIPTVPESLKNPNKLKLSGAVTAEYDGSSEVRVEIPAGGGSGYELPIASATQLGGVMPVAKTDEMTQAVGVDADGKLYSPATSLPTDEQVSTAVANYLAENPVTGGKWELIQNIVVEESVHTMNIDMRKNGKPTYWRDLFFQFIGVYDGPSSYSGGVNMKIAKGLDGSEWNQWNTQVNGVFHTAASDIPTTLELHHIKGSNHSMMGFTARNGGRQSEVIPRFNVALTDYEYVRLYFNSSDADKNIGAGTNIKIWGVEG